MLQVLNLKCPNCSGNLEISEEMISFACGYCGASQLVERKGGTVSLKLFADAISKVQIGTDRTAAELAIQRIKGEMLQANQTFELLEDAKQEELGKNYSYYSTVAGITLVVCLFFVFGSSNFIFIPILFLIIVESIIAYFWLNGKRRILRKFENEQMNAVREYRSLETKLAEYNDIVNR
jgi:hypothetical protein